MLPKKYITVQRFGIGKCINVFWSRLLWSPKAAFIQNTFIKNTFIYFLTPFKITVLHFNIFSNVIYCCHHYSSLQCHMILQKSFYYDDLLLNIHFINVENKTMIHFFSGISNETRIWNRNLLPLSINLMHPCIKPYWPPTLKLLNSTL